MREDDFRSWLSNTRGYGTGTVNSRVSNCKTVECCEGDLDEHFDQDRFRGLVEKLAYSKADERQNRPAMHQIPINGNVYDGTATLRSGVSLYKQFRENWVEDSPIVSATVNSARVRSSRGTTSSKGKTWPTWRQPGPAEVLALAHATATILNQGDIGARDVEVSFYQGSPATGGGLIGSTMVSSVLAPGDEQQVSLPWLPDSTSSPYSIYVVVDPNQTLDDANRANNVANKLVIRADLTIQSVGWERQTDGSVLVIARVTNLGSLPTPATTISFKRDSASGPLLSSTSLGALNPDQSVDLSLEWNTAGLTAAQYVLYMEADEDNLVDEYDETNNGTTLTIGLNPNAPVVSLVESGYAVPEQAGSVQIMVSRAGDISAAASVDYATSSGTANERSDYLAAVGTLRFAAGEGSKAINVFVVNDSFGENPETFNLNLSNPVGCTLGSPAVVTVTINSDESVNGQNPVKDASFNTDFFVRQHYVDFFNREADAPGLAFWKNQIDECTTQACREIRKINVSAAFFLSIEFQQTGYLVYKANQASFNSGEFLKLRDFLPDTQEIGRGLVVGQPGAEAQLEANKQNFFLDFVQRASFVETSAFPTTMTAAQFVDKLNGNTSDPSNPGSGGALSSTQRDALVGQLAPNPASPALRAQVLRSVSENSLFSTRQSNKAFVLMQYFGYLRRNPNDPPEAGLNFGGYNFWLSKLNQFNGNFVNAEMVKAFIVSGEYQQRFGP